MTGKRELDEYLEVLWHMKERGQDLVDNLLADMKETFDMNDLTELTDQGLIEWRDGRKKIYLTPAGENAAGLIIRSHRLAECLIYNVFGKSIETVACEFEHIITPELVDSICTLLGHPRECPRGMPIPQGQCCKNAANMAMSLVIPLTQMKIGEKAQIAYINCGNDQRAHVLENLHIRPGVQIQLQQSYPAFVISHEGASIALDEEIARNICLWRSTPEKNGTSQETRPTCGSIPKRKRFRFGWGKSKGKGPGANAAIESCERKPR